MDNKQAQRLLDKINSLFRTIASTPSDISAIERDLMRSYLQQLYAQFIEEDVNTETSFAPRTTQVESPAALSSKKPTYQPPKIIEIPDSLKNLREEVKSQPSSPPPPPMPRAKPQPKAPVQRKEPIPPAPSKPVLAPNAEIGALFEAKRVRELSDKLSTVPVSDLSRAMTINDRLLYQNTLFNNNEVDFRQAIQALNYLHDMDEARPLLYDLADEYEWTADEKKDTAKSFIKLVQRRYS